MNQVRVIHTGQVIIDLVMPIDRLPAPGGDTVARGATFEVGGGFNVMAAAARDGMTVVHAGGHGRGRFGDMAREAMRREGIEWLAQMDETLDTGFCVALVDQAAERTFITHTGAEIGHLDVLYRLTPEPGDHVLVSGYTLFHETTGRALTEWLDTLPDQVPVIFDPGPMIGELCPERLEKVMQRTTILSCNTDEARALTDTDSLKAATRALPARTSAPLIVVRDGPRGCHLLMDGHHQHIAGFATRAVDTNGAGDAHTGVLVAALSRGQTPEQAAQRANAAAALAVSRHGPATSPSGSEIDALLAHPPFP
ncbi:sugar/nucleoside kinase (ribokinase family) [Kushneria sinocarnis]|uniref:Sugar/nucleoside kinase (Ribokinase family) n=1 Tax=Kushneria sinocarnis TaxID=595502 RepID=A0A420WWB1_9GAMM|nr:PfkB family carbohydrate kinase [Kushneria sinocarnis]RKR03370.1 sugar/nucleoside kinase (ribokinase family) [Kushneria sinocarnis]